MPIKDHNNLVITRAASGKVLPENEGSVQAPNEIPADAAGQIDIPNDVDTEAAGQIAAPRTIANKSRVAPGGARILYGQELSSYGLAREGSGGADLNSIELGVNFNTYEKLVLDYPYTYFDVSASYPFTASGISISAHDIGSVFGSIGSIVIYDDNGNEVFRIEDYEVDSDHAILIPFGETVTVGRVMFNLGIPLTNQVEVEIGNILIGDVIELPPIYGGHRPAVLNPVTTYDNNITGTGQFVGRSIKRQGLETQFSFNHLDPYIVRNKIAPFLRHAERYPFVVQWRPDFFPEEAIYCWTKQNPSLSNMGGGHDLMQMTLDVEAYRGL